MPDVSSLYSVLTQKGIKTSVVGELTKPEKGMVMVEDGKKKRLKHPIADLERAQDGQLFIF